MPYSMPPMHLTAGIMRERGARNSTGWRSTPADFLARHSRRRCPSPATQACCKRLGTRQTWLPAFCAPCQHMCNCPMHQQARRGSHSPCLPTPAQLPSQPSNQSPDSCTQIVNMIEVAAIVSQAPNHIEITTLLHHRFQQCPKCTRQGIPKYLCMYT